MMKVSRIRGVLCWNVWLELECVVRAVKSECVQREKRVQSL